MASNPVLVSMLIPHRLSRARVGLMSFAPSPILCHRTSPHPPPAKLGRRRAAVGWWCIVSYVYYGPGVGYGWWAVSVGEAA